MLLRRIKVSKFINEIKEMVGEKNKDNNEKAVGVKMTPTENRVKGRGRWMKG
jgi:hypothetical protein